MWDFWQYPVIAIDAETTGLVYPRDRAFSFAITTTDMRSGYFDIRRNPEVIDWLNDGFKKFKGLIVNHNIAFDYKMLYQVGIRMPITQLEDTCTRACLINEHLMSYSLDDLSKKYLKEKKVSDIYESLAEIFGGSATRKTQIKNLKDAPPDIVAPYAKRDTELALRLWQWQEQEIEEQGIRQIVDFERSLMPTLIRAQMRGIKVNPDQAYEAMDRLTDQIVPLQDRLEELAGSGFNSNSPKQMREFLKPTQDDSGQWWCKGEKIEATKTGNPSLGADSLRTIDSEETRLILNLRSLIKTRDTFLAGHVLGHEVNGRVYPTINQNKGEDGGTGTGRLSYVDPAMQQIPSRDKVKAAVVKPIFEPDDDMVWVDSDKASFEVRVFAHLVNDQHINDQYQKNPNADFHQMVADLTGLVRNATYSGQPNAKQLNLSMIFNSGNGAIADKMGMSWDWESFTPRGSTELVTYKKAGVEAMEVIENYHRRLPGVKALATKAQRLAENRGYIKTHHGRRIRFPKGYKSYKASGLAIQATAADINKQNWMIIEEVLGGRGHLILNTHDSYSLCLPPDWKEIFQEIKREVENNYPWFRVPLILELSGYGPNWWEAVK